MNLDLYRAAPAFDAGFACRIRQAIGRTKLKFCDPFLMNGYS
jgi:hypothetical protein